MMLQLVMAFVTISTIIRNATMMAEIAVEVAKSLITALTVHVFKIQVSMKTNVQFQTKVFKDKFKKISIFHCKMDIIKDILTYLAFWQQSSLLI